ncbi:(2Fe-2S)-binding protein [Streptomyces sp. F63]|uniref:2Fe-2S iron-sulfur cluster-binding protein n=1 Tax=Streptomyces sp. F63 TaxID=2824887 RepID=UPI001B38F143|nr:2Fe-2S iron-sulfur cluster-binding protein [Streptomyces sp. F63]MBQ0987522.1 (2Fe-2S)-binding protein [Streptomyces sp. F63]
MTNDQPQHPQGPYSDEEERPAGGWRPTAQSGEFDSEATAFVQLPEGLLDPSAGREPLAAPGQGYAPPPVEAAYGEPPEGGQWTMPYTDPGAGPQYPWQQQPQQPPQQQQGHGHGGHEQGRETGWPPEESTGHGGEQHTGAWSVPPAADDAPDESGEYLVGGAAAPAPGPWSATGAAAGDGWDQHGGAAGEQGGPGAGGPPAGDTGPQQWGYAPGGQQPPAHRQDQPANVPAPGDTWSDAWERPAPANAPGPARDTGGAWGTPAPGTAGDPGDGSGSAPPEQWTAHGAREAAPAGGPVPYGDDSDSRDDSDGRGVRTDTGAAPGTTAPAGPGEEARSAPSGDWRPGAADGTPAGGDGADRVRGETGEPPRTGEHAPGQRTTAGHPSGDGAGDGDGSRDGGGSDTAPDGPAGPGEAGAEEPDGPDTPPEIILDAHSEHPYASYVLRVNGIDRPVADAWIGESLLYVLRERLGLAGAKDGCSQGECGACSVQVDGRLVASCLVPAATTAGSEVRTVEGLAAEGTPSDVQRALVAGGAVQCGFCVPGLAMTVHDLLEGNHAPTELETRQALCGNLCRCTGYRGVLDAVREVVASRAESAEAAAQTAADAEAAAADAEARAAEETAAEQTAGGLPQGPHPGQPHEAQSYGGQPYDERAHGPAGHGIGAHGSGDYGNGNGHIPAQAPHGGPHIPHQPGPPGNGTPPPRGRA